MHPRTLSASLTVAATAMLLATGAGVEQAAAQREPLARSSNISGGGSGTELNALEKGRYAILIDLDVNRLYFKQGDLTLWSAPVGTGKGIRVISDDGDWVFTTPNGRFQVQYKELDPVWIAPDWYFLENNLPIPAANDASRYMHGTLGVAAVYIAPDLAIHGTERPDLIGQRVSHGCIRLENRYAMRLYNNVQVGTEVIIVGGQHVEENARTVDLRNGYDPSLAPGPGPELDLTDEVYERWQEMKTPDLVRVLRRELGVPASESRWDQVAILLVDRASEDDDAALEALFALSGSLPTEAIEKEWATYLTEVYRRSEVRTLRALAKLDRPQRREIAEMLVSATLTLYGGDFDTPSAPWPTSRIPERLVPRNAQAGWDSLLAAERDHRERIRTASAR